MSRYNTKLFGKILKRRIGESIKSLAERQTKEFNKLKKKKF